MRLLCLSKCYFIVSLIFAFVVRKWQTISLTTHHHYSCTHLNTIQNKFAPLKYLDLPAPQHMYHIWKSCVATK